MHWEGALGAAIEVAIAIAGFSGIVAAVGRRNPGSWTAADQIRLRILLTASAAAGLFAFLPFILFEAGLSDPVCWRVGSGAQAAWFISVSAYRLRQESLTGVSAGIATKGGLVVIGVVLVAQLANAVYAAQSWIYLLGVVFQLFIAFSAFVALLLDSSRDQTPAA